VTTDDRRPTTADHRPQTTDNSQTDELTY